MKDKLLNKGKQLLNNQLEDMGLGSLGKMLGGGLDKALGGSGGNGDFAKGLERENSMSRYRLAISSANATMVVKSVQATEALSNAWQYRVRFTSTQHNLSVNQVLSQRAVLVLAPPSANVSIGSGAGKGSAIMGGNLFDAFSAFGDVLGKVGMASPFAGKAFSQVKGIGQSLGQGLGQGASMLQKGAKLAGKVPGLDSVSDKLSGFANKLTGASNLASSFEKSVMGENRVIHGVVIAFSHISRSREETEYEVVIAPRLALLANSRGSAIYQNQTVPEIVEAVLRRHEMSGVDFRFELKETYAKREYTTQWQEDDLTFIRRLLADVGIWFRFESHSKHDCDVVVFGDNEQPWQQGPTVPYHAPSGMNDNVVAAIWQMSVERKTVPQSVQTQDYNYRNAQAVMLSEVNVNKKDNTLRGRQYFYGEHYRERGEQEGESGGSATDNLLDKLTGGITNPLKGDGKGFSISPEGINPGGIASGAINPTGINPGGINGGGITAGIGDMASNAGNQLKQKASEGVDKVKSGVSAIGDSLSGLASGGVGGLLDGAGSLLNKLSEGDSSDAEGEKGNGQGSWIARVRHQRFLTEQITIRGVTSLVELAPGQLIRVTDAPIAEAANGLIIVSVDGAGSRENPYQIEFTAIPYDVTRPYRPATLPWPTVSGTLPARVTSPANDKYGYLDTQGRYRVKMDFDLNSEWKKGEESLWVRLAKPYAGATYGMHFPLIDGTEVAIAFTEGNPDRPYIAHGMHDSRHPDLVTAENHKRNVIRTPSNNKLRMDDEEGKEHIKLATEYGKTQLNLGHLVDSKREQRGQGFELRTDEWGALAAEKGLYLTTETAPGAAGKQLDMQAAITQLENALSIAKALQNAANNSQAYPADIQGQEALKSTLSELNQSGVMAYAKQGIGLTSPENIQLSTSSSISMTAENQADISVLKKITLAAGEALSLFAQKSGIKMFASKGKVEIQAQNDAMALAAKQNITIGSAGGKVTITAPSEITLVSGGSYIKIDSSGIELGSSGNVSLKCAAMQKMGPANMQASTDLPGEKSCQRTANDQVQSQHATVELD